MFRANIALAGLTQKYKNAFSLVSPLILDSTIMTTNDDTYQSRLRHMSGWGMSARGIYVVLWI